MGTVPLYRSLRDAKIGGVASGLAKYLAMDVSIVRLIWVAAFFMGFGLLAYIIAWIVIPAEDSVISAGESDISREGKQPLIIEEDDGINENRMRIAGLVLIFLGILFILHQFLPGIITFLWPLALIASGIFIISRMGKN